MAIEVKAFRSEHAQKYVDELAGLRMRIFRDYPYLYDGSVEYEQEYLSRYFEATNSVVFLVFNSSDAVIGATTCIPLSEKIPEIQKPFRENGLNVEEYFYFGESLLEKTYRGKGFGRLFFEYREKEALRHPQIHYSCFCAVSRPVKHPLKPDNYRSLEPFWRNLRYNPQPEIYTSMAWKDIDKELETAKKLQFWVKKLR